MTQKKGGGVHQALSLKIDGQFEGFFANKGGVPRGSAHA
jgi:hypothetical protein